MSSGIAEVQARIAAIESRFAPLHRADPHATRAGSVPAFANALSRAQAPVAAALSAPPPAPASGAGGADGQQVVDVARRYLGVPYVWGGTDPSVGLDCSGFVQRAYRDLGVELPRVSADQARSGRAVPSLADARPGDLVAFDWSAERPGIDHIGIYVGDNKMINAPRRGDVVRIQEITRPPAAIRRIVGSAAATAVEPLAATALTGVPFGDLFVAAGNRYGVSPALLAAVARTESGFDPRAVSSAGAQGLMQLMPATARGLGVATRSTPPRPSTAPPVCWPRTSSASARRSWPWPPTTPALVPSPVTVESRRTGRRRPTWPRSSRRSRHDTHPDRAPRRRGPSGTVARRSRRLPHVDGGERVAAILAALMGDGTGAAQEGGVAARAAAGGSSGRGDADVDDSAAGEGTEADATAAAAAPLAGLAALMALATVTDGERPTPQATDPTPRATDSAPRATDPTPRATGLVPVVTGGADPPLTDAAHLEASPTHADDPAPTAPIEGGGSARTDAVSAPEAGAPAALPADAPTAGTPGGTAPAGAAPSTTDAEPADQDRQPARTSMETAGSDAAQGTPIAEAGHPTPVGGTAADDDRSQGSGHPVQQPPVAPPAGAAGDVRAVPRDGGESHDAGSDVQVTAPSSAPAPHAARADAPASPTTSPSGPPAPATPDVQVVRVLVPLREAPDGTHRVTLHLQPEELGEVQVDVRVRGTEISLHLRTEHLRTGELLRATLPELRTELEANGFHPAAIDVSGHGPGAHPDGERAAAAPQLRSELPDEGPPEPPVRLTSPAARVTTKLDLRL